jgi:lipopolysaccharide biosynthesis protein
MKLPKKVAVLYHIFYEDSMDFIVKELEDLHRFQPYFFFNISSDTPNLWKIRETLSIHFPGAVICKSSNKGKDIGGKLLLLSTCMQLGIKPDWFVFLHDKKSLQALNAKIWKQELLRIIEANQIDKIESIISDSEKCGIIAANNYVNTEERQGGEFVGNNGHILDGLLLKYNIVCKDFHYIAGTMFWAKAAALLPFFTEFNPLDIRQTLESGNVLDNFGGTFTHAWERMLSWIITSQGFQIKTV